MLQQSVCAGYDDGEERGRETAHTPCPWNGAFPGHGAVGPALRTIAGIAIGADWPCERASGKTASGGKGREKGRRGRRNGSGEVRIAASTMFEAGKNVHSSFGFIWGVGGEAMKEIERAESQKQNEKIKGQKIRRKHIEEEKGRFVGTAVLPTRHVKGWVDQSLRSLALFFSRDVIFSFLACPFLFFLPP